MKPISEYSIAAMGSQGNTPNYEKSLTFELRYS
jgi:hypothetical protein